MSSIPLTPRGRETAARLRDAARQVFAEAGYAAARVEDIVTVAGTSHGTFYTYYENKAAVLAGLIAQSSARLQAIAEAPWDVSDDLRRTLEEVIGDFLEVYAEESDVVLAWIEAAATDPDFRSRLAVVRSDFVERVADNLRPAAEAGAHDPRTAANALVAMVEGYAIEQLGGRRAAPREVVRTLAALWRGGLLALSEPD